MRPPPAAHVSAPWRGPVHRRNLTAALSHEVAFTLSSRERKRARRDREARAEGAAAAAGLLPAWQSVKMQAQSAVASALKCALSLL